jgi:ligand-binding sensor protein
MKKSIIEVIKTNKKAIIKRSLVIVGTVVGLAIVGKLATSKDDEDEDVEEVGDENPVDGGESVEE